MFTNIITLKYKYISFVVVVVEEAYKKHMIFEHSLFPRTYDCVLQHYLLIEL